MFNIGMMMDIPTGTYFLGKNGESILNGGKPAIMSIAGPKNAGKTILALAIELTVGERIKPYQCSIYDTEVSLLYSRLNQLSGRYERMRNIVHGDENLIPEQVKFIITSSAEILGDVYFKSISDLANMKKKDKNIMLTTPLFDSKGQSIKIRVPTGSMIDSLTEFKTTNVEEKMVSKNNVGDSGNNMMWMKQGIAKKQLITQLPNMCANAGMFVTLTAHVGKEFDMDPMAPKEHRLAFQKKGSEYKGVTEAFEFINNIVYEIFDARALQNKVYKTTMDGRVLLTIDVPLETGVYKKLSNYITIKQVAVRNILWTLLLSGNTTEKRGKRGKRGVGTTKQNMWCVLTGILQRMRS